MILTKVSGSLVDENNSPVTRGSIIFRSTSYTLKKATNHYNKKIDFDGQGQFKDEGYIDKNAMETILWLETAQFSEKYNLFEIISIQENNTEKIISNKIALRPGDDLKVRLKLIKKM